MTYDELFTQTGCHMTMCYWFYWLVYVCGVVVGRLRNSKKKPDAKHETTEYNL